MNKHEIKVPGDQNIKYISEWRDYNLPTGHCIVDKGVTGCGYTEFCLTNKENVVLCSPRKLLLENKAEQHQDDSNILYLKNEISGIKEVRSMKDKIRDHVIYCDPPFGKKKSIKFLVTYDSSHYVIEALRELGRLEDFYFVVDEFQSIFLDSYFKSEVEFDFIEYLDECPNVLYLSATPMLDKYLEKVDEFKDLDFYRLDWSETGIVDTIIVKRKFARALTTECNEIISEYLKGNFPMTTDKDGNVSVSKEAVFYFNSLGDIIRSINKMGLNPNQVNIVCSDTSENKEKLRKIGHSVGKIPLKDQPNKMFTFCTRSAYIGADFYSSCASSYVFADPNIASLALDISLDLPQIVGRQRDRSNPFKNEITVFYRTIRKGEIENREVFEAKQKQRYEDTKKLLEGFNELSEDKRLPFIQKLKRDSELYVHDFVGISKKTGLPIHNYFIEIANERAWDVSQKDYQDKISVTKALDDISTNLQIYQNDVEKDVQNFLDNHFYKTGIFSEKMKMYCDFLDEHSEFNQELQDIIYFKIKDERFRKYYNFYGTSGCKSRKYRDDLLKSGMSDASKENELQNAIYNKFSLGDVYSKKDLKLMIGNIYRDLGVSRNPKATDLKDYFSLSRVLITDKVTKKRLEGYRLTEKGA